jgi:hypothetical protein
MAARNGAGAPKDLQRLPYVGLLSGNIGRTSPLPFDDELSPKVCIPAKVLEEHKFIIAYNIRRRQGFKEDL